MLTHQEIVALWGEANTRMVPAAVLDTHALPQDTKLMLGTVGVPHMPDLFGINLLDEGSLDLPLIVIPNSPDQWLRVGLIHNESRRICLHSSSGEVWCVVGHRGTELFFMNRSLETLVEFLSVFRQNWLNLSYHGEDAKEWEVVSTAAAIPVERSWRDIDSRAMEPDTYWSTILEEVKSGLLS